MLILSYLLAATISATPHTITKRDKVQLTVGQQTTIETFYTNRICPLVDALYGETGVCTGTAFRDSNRRVILLWDTTDNAYYAHVVVRRSGTFTPD